MFFIFSKLLSFAIAPLTWIFALLVWAIFTKQALKRRKLLISALLVLYFFSNSFLLNLVMRNWEIAPKKHNELSSYDAGIVLGGMLWYDKEFDRMQFTRSTDRVMQAVDLYKRGIIKKIVFTGGSGSILHQDMKEGKYAEQFLLNLGIPATDILIESESNNTRENAVFTQKLLAQKMPAAKCLLITSAFHMRRSIGCFNKVGMQFDYYSTDRYSGPYKLEFDYLLIPSSLAFEEWKMLIHELVGYVVYKISGYA